MHHAAGVPMNVVDQDADALDVDEVRHRRIELARFERTVADRVEDAAEAVQVEEPAHPRRVLGVLRDDSWPCEPKRLVRPDADDLTRVARPQGAKGVVAGNSGDPGDEKRQTILEHVRRRREKREPRITRIRQETQCFRADRIGAPSCPYYRGSLVLQSGCEVELKLVRPRSHARGEAGGEGGGITAGKAIHARLALVI